MHIQDRVHGFLCERPHKCLSLLLRNCCPIPGWVKAAVVQWSLVVAVSDDHVNTACLRHPQQEPYWD